MKIDNERQTASLFELFQNINAGRYESLKPLNINPDLKNLIHNMLKTDPKNRPTSITVRQGISKIFETTANKQNIMGQYVAIKQEYMNKPVLVSKA